MNGKNNIKVIISGGGTGGHLFPAIAIADAIKEKMPDAEFLFVGANGKIEMEKVPQLGYKVVGLNIAGFQRSLSLRNLSFPFKLLGSMWKAYSTVKSFKPDIAIGTGGYASGPTLKAAEWLGIPTVIQEQNAFPGVTNKLLGKKAHKIFAAFENLGQFFDKRKIVVTGNPLRKIVSLQNINRTLAIEHFGLSPQKPVIFITGGSLGALAVNKAIAANIDLFNENEIQLIWQCGKFYENEYMPFNSETVKVLTFIDKMDFAYTAADVIISRAGAGTISELALVGKPTIMLPSPNVAEDHQTKNVLSLVAKEATIMVKDTEAEEKLGHQAFDLINNPELKASLSKNIAAFAKPNAAEDIANEVLHLLGINIPKKEVLDLKKIKSIYFLGIGGIGMSALARHFHQLGIKVAGYDKTATVLTRKLEDEGIDVNYIDHEDALDKHTDLVVYTPAIPKNNVQLNYYQQNNFKLYKRAAILGELTKDKFCIAIAGSHGKTTVSSMIAHILNETEGCTAFLGGIANNFNSNYLHSNNNFVVVEADEYDRSFLTLNPNIAVVTSIDSDHLDVYGSYENIKKEFQQFAQLLPKDGVLITQNQVKLEVNCKKMSYSIDTNSLVKIENYKIEDGSYVFDAIIGETSIENLQLNIGGRYNVENALAAISVAVELGISTEKIKNALSNFKGIKRRFEKIISTDNLIYIDDYAHHPNELKVLLDAVKELYPALPIIAIFQPHLFSRTRDLAEDFASVLSIVDRLILLPIYPAREEPLEGVTSEIILEKAEVEFQQILEKHQVLELAKTFNEGVVITIGAGDIDTLVNPLKDIFESKISQTNE